jgi:hypothetical protein
MAEDGIAAYPFQGFRQVLYLCMMMKGGPI